MCSNPWTLIGMQLSDADVDDVGRWLEEAWADAKRYERESKQALAFARACADELERRGYRADFHE